MVGESLRVPSVARQPEHDMGRWFRAARERAGLSQGALADRLGVHRVTVSSWESGRRCPSLVTARLIAEVLGCCVCELATGASRCRHHDAGCADVCQANEELGAALVAARRGPTG